MFEDVTHATMALVDKVFVDIYAKFQLSIKHICKDIHSSIEKYEVSHLVFAIKTL